MASDPLSTYHKISDSACMNTDIHVAHVYNIIFIMCACILRLYTCMTESHTHTHTLSYMHTSYIHPPPHSYTITHTQLLTVLIYTHCDCCLNHLLYTHAFEYKQHHMWFIAALKDNCLVFSHTTGNFQNQNQNKHYAYYYVH